MNKIMRVAVREFVESFTRKAFIVGGIIFPILISGAIVAMTLLKEPGNIKDRKIVLIDHSGFVATMLEEALKQRNETGIFDKESGKQVRPAYHLEVVEPANDLKIQKLELSCRVKRKEIHAFLEVDGAVVDPAEAPQAARIFYYSENPALDEMKNWISWPINNHLITIRLKAAGLDDELVKGFFNWVPVEGRGLLSVDKGTGRVQDARTVTKFEALGIPAVMAFLLLIIILMCTTPLVASTLEEKTNRISEILLASARPFELMMGKLIGNLGVSIAGAVVYAAMGIIAVSYMKYSEFIPYHVLPWFFVYLTVAIFMNGAIFVAVGAACNDSREVQALILPAMIPMLFPLMVTGFILKDPLSGFSTWISLIPPFTPVAMLLRQASAAAVPLWQPYVGLAGVIIFTLFTVWLSGRIFRVGFLMQGKGPSIKDLIRWAIKG